MRLTAWEMVPVEQIQVIELLKKPLPFTKTTHTSLPSVQKPFTSSHPTFKKRTKSTSLCAQLTPGTLTLSK
jgi:hypothetical protein